jgi:hypothetical protein
MKRYILDTNILIKDPSILTKWSGNYRLIIPDIILEEASYVSGRLTGSKGLIHSIENSTSKGFVKVIQVDRNRYPFNESLGKDFRISYTDYVLAHFAKDYAKDKPETYLVTEDRRLSGYADFIGLKTQNLFGFQSDILSNKTVDISEVGLKSNIRSFQFRHIAISFISGIALTLMSYLVYKNFELITQRFPVWGTVAAFSLIPFVFYWFRSNVRIGYAIAEFSFGYFSVMYTIKPLAEDFDISKIYEVAAAVPVVGGIYVMVRGLDNFSKGVEGTILERPWKKIFKD